MVGAGSAEFGISSADEVIVARARGNDVVAVFAVYQNNPQGIMVHASRHLESIGDVFKEGTIALQRGLPYARILEKRYGDSRLPFPLQRLQHDHRLSLGSEHVPTKLGIQINVILPPCCRCGPG